jgi:alanine racemase
MSDRRDAWIEIDHDALRSNVAALRARTAPDVALCGVVKANAYGHGALGCARTILDAGAAMLAVITVDEGMQLRVAGIDAPILLLHEPPAARIPEVLEHALTPTVFTERILTSLDAATTRPLGVHLKVDTGLNRLGVPFRGLDAFIDGPLARAHRIQVSGVFTHFAFADEPANPVIDQQLSRFGDALEALKRAGIEPPLRHAANSAATLSRPDAHFDMVRPGVALYGLSPGPQVPNTEPLRAVLSLKARVAQVKRVQPGDGVSYAHRWIADRETTVATLPLGYADGWPRALTNNARVLIAGEARDAIGTVTMDSFAVDCGDADVAVGDEAVLIGSQASASITADELAERLGTINYEVVTRLAARLPRERRS